MISFTCLVVVAEAAEVAEAADIAVAVEASGVAEGLEEFQAGLALFLLGLVRICFDLGYCLLS